MEEAGAEEMGRRSFTCPLKGGGLENLHRWHIESLERFHHQNTLVCSHLYPPTHAVPSNASTYTQTYKHLHTNLRTHTTWYRHSKPSHTCNHAHKLHSYTHTQVSGYFVSGNVFFTFICILYRRQHVRSNSIQLDNRHGSCSRPQFYFPITTMPTNWLVFSQIIIFDRHCYMHVLQQATCQIHGTPGTLLEVKSDPSDRCFIWFKGCLCWRVAPWLHSQ